MRLTEVQFRYPNGYRDPKIEIFGTIIQLYPNTREGIVKIPLGFIIHFHQSQVRDAVRQASQYDRYQPGDQIQLEYRDLDTYQKSIVFAQQLFKDVR